MEASNQYIGDEKNSPLEDDLEALTNTLPTVVKAKIEYGSNDGGRLERAVEAITFTISNLRDVLNEAMAAR